MVQAMRLVNPIASVKRLKCDLSVATELPETVVGDDKRLMQIALNVVGNAVKFTKEGLCKCQGWLRQRSWGAIF